jgi:hypothetical protein
MFGSCIEYLGRGNISNLINIVTVPGDLYEIQLMKDDACLYYYENLQV